MSPLQRFLVAAIAIAVAIVFALLAVYLITGGYVPSHYAVVFELKSTTTSVILYKWAADLRNNTGLVHVDDYCEATEVISDADGGSVKDVENLLPCLKKFINKSNDVEIFVGATSAMRHFLLTDADFALQQMKDIKHLLNSQIINQSRINLLPPKILTDEDEATFLWIAVNYLRNNFGAKYSNVRKMSKGVIYIDDLSSLIAYESNNVSMITDPRTVELYGKNFTLRADGNLCNGIEEIYNKYLALLIMKQGADSFVSDPCGSKQQQRTVDGKQFANNGCVLKNNSIEIDTSKTYLFVGHYNYDECLELIESIFDQDKCSAAFGICPQLEQNKPENRSFVVIQTPYSYIDDDIIANLTSIESFVNASKSVCDNSPINSNSPNRTQLTQCFVLNYYYVLLTKMYKFDEKTWQSIHFETMDVAHWSLGYTIYTTNYATAIAPTEPWISMHIILITLAVCLILITVAVCLIRRQLDSNSEVSIVKVY